MPQQRKPFTIDEVRRQGKLKKGDILGGPEPYGCFNSGFRPTLAHLNAPTVDIFVVGPELAAADVRKQLKRAEVRMALGLASQKELASLRKQVFRQPKDPAGTRTVFAFRSKAPAIAKFVELCNARLAENAQDRAEHSAALLDARSSDPATAIAGALRASDF